MVQAYTYKTRETEEKREEEKREGANDGCPSARTHNQHTELQRKSARHSLVHNNALFALVYLYKYVCAVPLFLSHRCLVIFGHESGRFNHSTGIDSFAYPKTCSLSSCRIIIHCLFVLLYDRAWVWCFSNV